MKRMCRIIFITTILLVLFNVYPQFCFAQIGDPGEDPDAPVPIDGGVSLLIAAGVGYGFKKAHDKRKKKNSTANFPESDK